MLPLGFIIGTSQKINFIFLIVMAVALHPDFSMCELNIVAVITPRLLEEHQSVDPYLYNQSPQRGGGGGGGGERGVCVCAMHFLWTHAIHYIHAWGISQFQLYLVWGSLCLPSTIRKVSLLNNFFQFAQLFPLCCS